jgi:hypothetical protein
MLACLGLLYSAIFQGDDGLKGFKALNDDKVLRAWLMEKFDHLCYYFESSYTFFSFRVTSTK